MKKKTKKTTAKPKSKQKAKGATQKRKSLELADSLYMNPGSDPAHSPGHRKMNLKEKFAEKKGSKTHPQNDTALNNMTRAARVQRTSSANRRIITGAGLGKTGQITTK